MLTIKHIIWNGGFETLYQAKEVRTKYSDPLDGHPMPAPGSGPPRQLEFVAFDLPNGDVRSIKFGKVYVMNEAGKTVAKYDFGYDPDNQPEAPAPSSVTITGAPATAAQPAQLVS